MSGCGRDCLSGFPVATKGIPISEYEGCQAQRDGDYLDGEHLGGSSRAINGNPLACYDLRENRTRVVHRVFLPVRSKIK